MKFDSEARQRIIDSLQNDELIYMPTDTIPGLVCLAKNQVGVEKIFKLKRRDATKPPTIIISNTSQLNDLLISLTPAIQSAVDSYWPGPVNDSLEMQYLHRGAMSLAVRLTNNKDLAAIIDQTGPVATSSANLEGQSPATTPKEARNYFGQQIRTYIEHPPLQASPSKIIRINPQTGAEERLR